MKKIIAKFILFWAGWQVDYPSKYMVDKCVMIAAPHTSNWDLLYTVMVYWKKDVAAKFLIKDYYTKGIFGFFFKWLGALGVDRSKKNNFVDYAVELLINSNKLVLLVPAEGTRLRVEKWKTGFYHIAKLANVPVAMGFLDYQKKIAGVGGLYPLTDNFNTDMLHIQNFYKNIEPKHPEKYNQKIF